jgi:hypothetical protein
MGSGTRSPEKRLGGTAKIHLNSKTNKKIEKEKLYT